MLPITNTAAYLSENFIPPIDGIVIESDGEQINETLIVPYSSNNATRSNFSISYATSAYYNNLSTSYDSTSTFYTTIHVPNHASESIGQQVNNAPTPLAIDNDGTVFDIFQDQAVFMQIGQQLYIIPFESDFLINFCMEYSRLFRISPEETFHSLLVDTQNNDTDDSVEVMSQSMDIDQVIHSNNKHQISVQDGYRVSPNTNFVSPSSSYSSSSTSSSSSEDEWMDLPSNTLKRKFSCNFLGCNKVYGRHQELKRHKDERHSKEKKYGCAFCGKRFSRAYVLKNHQIIKNNQSSNRKCKGQKMQNVSPFYM